VQVRSPDPVPPHPPAATGITSSDFQRMLRSHGTAHAIAAIRPGPAIHKQRSSA
jgi:hypothetical protein